MLHAGKRDAISMQKLHAANIGLKNPCVPGTLPKTDSTSMYDSLAVDGTERVNKKYKDLPALVALHSRNEHQGERYI